MVFKTDNFFKVGVADTRDNVRITDAKYLEMNESYVFWGGDR